MFQGFISFEDVSDLHDTIHHLQLLILPTHIMIPGFHVRERMNLSADATKF